LQKQRLLMWFLNFEAEEDGLSILLDGRLIAVDGFD
jgi:hypothetical protein